MNDQTRQPSKHARGTVHSALAHDSAVKHVTGAAIYVDDILEPSGLLHAYVGTSQVAHGRLRSLYRRNSY